MTNADVVVIGAGPYGLAAAAHLRAAGLKTRVFGEPMQFWAEQMPIGMSLRSPWNASNIGDPQRELTLDAFAREYDAALSAAQGVPLDAFVAYGRWFQSRAVPEVDSRAVVRVGPAGRGAYEVVTDDGDVTRTRRVVVAAGLAAFAAKPAPFAALERPRVLHSSELADPGAFAGSTVAVVGAGQSALESAALLAEAAAEVEVLVRRTSVHWRRRWFAHRPWTPLAKVAYAPSLVGPAGLCWLTESPTLLRRLPTRVRGSIDRIAMRPEADAPLVLRLGTVVITPGTTVHEVVPGADAIRLKLADGGVRHVDHVVLATGYTVDVARYAFLAPELLAGVRRVGGYPVLDATFESSARGLHFVGAAAAWSFGPLMRFVAGSRYAAVRVTRAAQSADRSPRPAGSVRRRRVAATPGP